MTPRDTTKALTLVRHLQDLAGEINRTAVEVIHMLEATDARETRKDPRLRQRKEPRVRKR